MKRNFLVASAIAVSVALASCGGAAEEGAAEEGAASEEMASEEMAGEATDYTLNTEGTSIEWTGTSVGIYSHTGTIKISSGGLTIQDGAVTGGKVEIDMNSILTTDSDDLYKESSRDDLIGHLKSPDFFNTGEFPTATFVVKSFAGGIITGDLTLKGVTNEEKITSVTVEEVEGEMEATGTLTFDRQKYGVSWAYPVQEMVLSDNIDLQILAAGSSK